MARTYEISFKLGAQMAANFARTMSSAGGALGQLTGQISQLSKQQSSLTSLIKLRNEVGESAREYNQARQRVAELGKAMSQTSNPTREMTQGFEKAQREVAKAKERLDTKRESLRRLDSQMGTTGQSTRQLVSRQQELAASAEKARKAQASLQDSLSAQQANLQRRGELRGQLFDAAALGASVVAFTSGYREMQKAQGELATLGVSENGLAAITRSAEEMSNQVAGVTVPDFIRASYDIRSGIESISEVAVGEFTKIASNTAAATKSTVGEMTNLFAKGYGIYRQQFDRLGADVVEGWQKMSAEERDIRFGESFSAGISTAVKQFRTDGSQMSAALSNLGSNATAMGHSMAEQIAVLGALQKTMSGSEAATGYRAFLRGAVKAQDDLNLSFTDSNGQLKSTSSILEQLKRKYGETLSAANIAEINKAFGGDEAGRFISGLIQDVDSLSAGVDSVSQGMRRGAAATEEMAKAAQRGREFELLQQRLQNASTAISQGLVPAMLPVAEWMGKMAQKVGEAAERYPQLTKVIGVSLLGLIAFKVAAIAGAYAFTFLKGAWLSGVIVLKTLRVAWLLNTGALTANTTATKASIVVSKIMAAAQWVLNAAVSAGRWVWATAKMLAYRSAQIATTAVTKVGAAAQFLLNASVAAAKWVWATAKLIAYRAAQLTTMAVTKSITAAQLLFNASVAGAKWVWATAKMVAYRAAQITGAAVMKTITAAQWLFNAALSANPIGLVIAAIAALVAAGIALYKNWDTVTAFFQSGWNRLKEMISGFNPLAWMMAGFNKLMSYLSNFSLFSSGKKLLSTFASGIKAAVSVPVDAVRGALERVRNYLPFSDAKVGPLSQLTASGAAIMKTLGQGVRQGDQGSITRPLSRGLSSMMNGVQSGASGGINSAMNRLSGSGAAQGGSSAITLNVEQNISINGDGADVEAQARRGASEGAQDLLSQLTQAMNRERRLSYG